MKAIILAAGMGMRLGKYTENLPKCMLEVNGKPLIQRQVETLRSTGIKDIVIVRGYHPEKIQIPGVRYYENTQYADTNMVESLFAAEAELNGDVLVCYADILYESKVLVAVRDSSANIGVTVDTEYWEYWTARMEHPEDDIESLVIDTEGKIIELGDPHCSKDKAQVRYVGLIRFSPSGVEVLKRVYHVNRQQYYYIEGPWLRSKSFKKAYMTCMLQALIQAGYRVDPIRITHGWMEFDTVEDYERACQWQEQGSLSRFIHIDE